MKPKDFERGRVSVIVPTLNSDRTIERCLQSLRKQSFPNTEVIVVDNSSTDETEAISRQLATRVLSHGPERSTQRNVGADESTGEFLVFLDSDMIAPPSLTAEVVSTFEENPDIQALVIPERSVGEGYWAKCRALEKSLYVGDKNIEAARAFRRSTLIRLGGWNERLQGGGEDWELTERMRDAGSKIGRVRSFVIHDEGRLSLLKDARKKLYYGHTLARYAAGRPQSALRKLLRRSLLQGVRHLPQDPAHIAGMYLMKMVELLAVLAGIALSPIRRITIR